MFLAAAVFVWIATSPWREIEPAKVRPEWQPTETQIVSQPMQNFSAELDEHRKEVSELHEEIKRSSSEIAVGRQEFEWHTSKLMDRLNGMSNQLEEITTIVGTARIDTAKSNRKIDKSRRSSQMIR